MYVCTCVRGDASEQWLQQTTGAEQAPAARSLTVSFFRPRGGQECRGIRTSCRDVWVRMARRMIGLSHAGARLLLTNFTNRLLVLSSRVPYRGPECCWLSQPDLACQAKTKLELSSPALLCSPSNMHRPPAFRSCAVEQLQNVFASSFPKARRRAFPACGRKGESPGLAVCVVHRGSLLRCEPSVRSEEERVKFGQEQSQLPGCFPKTFTPISGFSGFGSACTERSRSGHSDFRGR